MLKDSEAFSGFAAPDLSAARTFYGETLGLDVETLEDGNLLALHLAGGRDVLGRVDRPQPDRPTGRSGVGCRGWELG